MKFKHKTTRKDSCGSGGRPASIVGKLFFFGTNSFTSENSFKETIKETFSGQFVGLFWEFTKYFCIIFSCNKQKKTLNK
jgi:hypothetical protein